MATDPICGMAVDPQTAELKLVRDNRTFYFCSGSCLRQFAEPAAELARLRRRLAVAWPLAVAIAALTYATPFAGWPYVAAAAAAVVQFYPGLGYYRGTWDAIRSRIWNMDILIAVGTTVAFGYSVAVLAGVRGLPIAYYFDASSLIVTLILTGNYLEHLTRERARGTLRALHELVPPTATIARDGVEQVVPVGEVVPGDRVHILPGARFPVDGVVVDGRSSATESLLTGESRPVPKEPGRPVVAGTTNGEGALWVEATGVGEDTVVGEIGRLVAEAETSQVPLQQLADRIASAFVPVVLALAVGAAVAWFLAGAGVSIALLVFVSVAITACPCAFGIATPAALVVGTGRAAEEGILFKGRDSLERASRVTVVLTDKTGTLTVGRPSLVGAVPVPGGTETDLLAVAAAVESGSEHPYARAVVQAATGRGIAVPAATELRVEPGRGVEGVVGGHRIDVRLGETGTPNDSDSAPLRALAAPFEAAGQAWSVVRRDGVPIGVLGFDDEIAPGVPQAVRALAADGIAVVMVTGDHDRAARRIAERAGIREVYSRQTPAEKLGILTRYRQAGGFVAYVGDGINDAPALAAADLGIAIGSGTDVARESSGVVLVRPDFRGVALALRLGRRTVRKVRANLTWAIGYNSVLLPVAVGVLVPWFGLRVYDVLPIVGAVAMGLSSTTVVLNSLSLRWVSLGAERRGRAAVPIAPGLPA